jgi:hypothetical protein
MAEPAAELQDCHVLGRPLESSTGSQTLQQHPALRRWNSGILGEPESNKGILAPQAFFSLGGLIDATAFIP